MSNVTLGKLKSEPDNHGKHTLKCPECKVPFLAKLTKDDTTGVINNVTCPVCEHSSGPKFFVAAAHQEEVNEMATDYIRKALKNRTFKQFRIDL